MFGFPLKKTKKLKKPTKPLLAPPSRAGLLDASAVARAFVPAQYTIEDIPALPVFAPRRRQGNQKRRVVSMPVFPGHLLEYDPVRNTWYEGKPLPAEPEKGSRSEIRKEKKGGELEDQRETPQRLSEQRLPEQRLPEQRVLSRPDREERRRSVGAKRVTSAPVRFGYGTRPYSSYIESNSGSTAEARAESITGGFTGGFAVPNAGSKPIVNAQNNTFSIAGADSGANTMGTAGATSGHTERYSVASTRGTDYSRASAGSSNGSNIERNAEINTGNNVGINTGTNIGYSTRSIPIVKSEISTVPIAKNAGFESGNRLRASSGAVSGGNDGATAGTGAGGNIGFSTGSNAGTTSETSVSSTAYTDRCSGRTRSLRSPRVSSEALVPDFGPFSVPDFGLAPPPPPTIAYTKAVTPAVSNSIPVSNSTPASLSNTASGSVSLSGPVSLSEPVALSEAMILSEPVSSLPELLLTALLPLPALPYLDRPHAEFLSPGSSQEWHTPRSHLLARSSQYSAVSSVSGTFAPAELTAGWEKNLAPKVAPTHDYSPLAPAFSPAVAVVSASTGVASMAPVRTQELLDLDLHYAPAPNQQTLAPAPGISEMRISGTREISDDSPISGAPSATPSAAPSGPAFSHPISQPISHSVSTPDSTTDSQYWSHSQLFSLDSLLEEVLNVYLHLGSTASFDSVSVASSASSVPSAVSSGALDRTGTLSDSGAYSAASAHDSLFDEPAPAVPPLPPLPPQKNRRLVSDGTAFSRLLFCLDAGEDYNQSRYAAAKLGPGLSPLNRRFSPAYTAYHNKTLPPSPTSTTAMQATQKSKAVGQKDVGQKVYGNTDVKSFGLKNVARPTKQYGLLGHLSPPRDTRTVSGPAFQVKCMSSQGRDTWFESQPRTASGPVYSVRTFVK